MSLSRGGYKDTPEKIQQFEKEKALFKNKWKDVLKAGDSFYNPNLTTDKRDFSLK